MTSADNPVQQPQRINRHRFVLRLLGVPLFLALFLFLPAGTCAWEKGWLFILVFLTLAVLAYLVIWRANPEFLAGWINPHRGTKRWDKVLFGFLSLTTAAILPVAALDDGRFHWLPLPWWVSLLGYALLVVCMAIPAVISVFSASSGCQARFGWMTPTLAARSCTFHFGSCWLLRATQRRTMTFVARRPSIAA
jgi:hypothetical protein